MAEVRIAGEDSFRLFLPVTAVAAVLKLLFYGGKGLEEKLAVVAESEGVLAGEAAGDLVEEDFSEDDVDGRGGLKIANGGQNVGGEDVAVGDSTHLAAEVIMTKRGVALVEGGGAAFAVCAEICAAAIG
jgi:hypothetical protein